MSSAAPAQPPVSSGQDAENRLSFNFRYAPWETVLKWYAERAGLTLDMNEIPTGTFNYFDDKSYSIIETLDVLNGYLIPRGHVLIRRDNFLVCVNAENGIPPNLIPDAAPNELSDFGKNELVRTVLPIPASANANELGRKSERDCRGARASDSHRRFLSRRRCGWEFGTNPSLA